MVFGGTAVTTVGAHAFDGCASLSSDGFTSAAMANVTAIGESAFYGCSGEGFTAFAIPSKVTAVSAYTFYGCTHLSALTFSGTAVTSVGAHAFDRCASLSSDGFTSAAMANVTAIGESAFYGCSGEAFTAFAIPSKVTAVSAYTFYGCTHLSALTFSGTAVTSVGDYAFHGCKAVESLALPADMTTIGAHAFEGCSALKYTSGTNVFVIPSKVTAIGASAFQDCTSLTTITTPAGLVTLENSVFKGCTGLTSIVISDSLTTISASAFEGCTSKNLERVSFGKGLAYVDPTAFSVTFNDCGTVVSEADDLKDKTFGRAADGILYRYDDLAGDHCFYVLTKNGTALRIFGDGDMYDFNSKDHPEDAPWETKVATVDIDYGVTSVGSYAFKDCHHLSTVDIPDWVKSVGKGAFQGCANLHTVILPDGLTAISDNLFDGCSNLDHIVIPEGVKSIGESAFRGTSLVAVDIPYTVTEIGEYAFCKCSSLESVTLSLNITEIKTGTFEDCSKLVSVSLPNRVTKIGDSAFENCSKLTSVDIPDSVTEIGDSAFESCVSLTEMVIPDSVTKIGGYTFAGCTSLALVVIPSGVTEIDDSAFFACCSLVSADIPSTVTRIGEEAFYACVLLTSVNVPANCTVGDKAFEGCVSLAHVTVGEKVSLGKDAFRSCDAIEEITFGDDLTSSETSVSSVFSMKFVDDATSANSTEITTIAGLSGNKFALASDGALHLYEGPCNSCHYRFDTNTGTLYIFGTGDMKDYTSSDTAPWHSYAGDIKAVSIDSGVTRIGSYAFDGCSNLTKVTVADTVTSVGAYSFNGCSALEEVSLDGVTAVGDYAFKDCKKLVSVNLHSNASVGKGAFCITASTVSGIADVTYDGTSITPTVTIFWNGEVLVMNKDFSVTYTDNKDAGTAKVTINGIGHYEGEKISTFTINPRAVTLTSGDYSGVYDGKTHTVSVTVTSGSFASTDSVTYSVGKWKDVCDETATITVDWGSVKESNYILTLDAGVISIQKRPVTITSGSYSGTYDGREHTVTVGLTYGSFADDDKVTYSVGKWKDVCDAEAAVTIDWGTVDKNNYSLVVNTSSVVIDKRPVTLTSGSYSGIYDGREHTVTVSVTYGSFASGDVVKYSVAAHKGVYEGTADVTVDWGTVDENNYDLTVNAGIISITQREVTLPDAYAGEMTYTAGTNVKSAVTLGALFNVVSGDKVSIDDSWTAEISSKNVGSRAVTLSLKLTGDDAANYRLTTPSGLRVTVTPLAVQVKDVTVAEKIYDGTTSATVSGGSVTGISGDELILLTDGAYAVFSGASAGEHTVFFYGYALDGTDAGNYTIVMPDSVKKVIEKREVTLTSGSYSAEYDGEFHTVSVTVTGSFAAGEHVTYTVGQWRDVCDEQALITVDWGTVDASNYSLTLATGNVSISQRAVTITSGSYSAQYDGDYHTVSITVTGSGFAAGDVVTCTVGQWRDVCKESAEISVDWGTVKASNYKLTLVPGSVAISQREVTLTAGDYKDIYDGDYHTVSVTVTGSFAAGDVVTYTVGQWKDVCTEKADITVDWGTVDENNYKLTLVSGDVKISQREVTLTAGDYKGIYDGDYHTVSVTVTGSFAAGEHVTYTVGQWKDVCTEKADITVDWGTVDENNYKLTLVSGDVSIAKKDVTVSSASYEGVYDALAHTVVITISGFVKGESVSVDTQSFTNVCKDQKVTCEVVWDNADANNYNLTTDFKGTVTITAKAVGISGSVAKDKVYNGDDVAVVIPGVLNGLVGGDTVKVTVDSATFNNKNAGENKEVTVRYKLSSENYVLDDEILTADITPLAISITGSKVTDKVYNGDRIASVTAGTLHGYLSTDDVKVDKTYGLFYTKDVGDNKVVSVTYTLGGDDAGNYTLAGETLYGKVTPKALSITDPTIGYKIYDGTALADVSVGVIGDLVTGDVVTATAVGLFDSADAGQNIPVTVTYILGGASAGNYTLADSHVKADISQRVLGISGSTVKDKGYNGKDDAVVTPGVLTNVVSGEYVKVTASGTFMNVNAGDRDVTVTYTLSSDNYLLDGQTLTGHIDRKDVTVSVNASKAEDGSVFTYEIQTSDVNLVEGDVVTEGTIETTGTDKGVYTVQGRDWTIVVDIQTRNGVSNYNIVGYDVILSIVSGIITYSDFQVDTGDEVFTGSAITKTITPLTGLVFGTDYTVRYENNTYVGTATIIISGAGEYTGTLEYHFTITQMVVDVPDPLYYIATGSLIRFDLPTSDWYTETSHHARSGTNPGTYDFHLSLVDSRNCRWSDDSFTGEYHVYITLKEVRHYNDHGVVDVIISGTYGIRADYKLIVVATDDVSGVSGYDYNGGTPRYDYDVKFVDADGKEVQPLGTLTIQLLIPDTLMGGTYDIYHVHAKTAERMESSVSGAYVTVKTGDLSDFVMVSPSASGDGSQTLAVAVAVVLGLGILTAIGVAAFSKRKAI